ncbi:heavy-metal-associated domain-containing protein [Clostridium tyrobutyricum]|uniref:heavy-metal-associated domain-containing protein n=1 Tax=Clostridium tyrobutyricum TaxID=1519 RepID=UPI001C38D135|nr:heavy-metal-associated domain-containing protein [Clostridium tyrobutyricum]MBV4447204.1 heavy-metal-associated domain-containing protein [Clostridium tyrobutyricum]
MESIFKISNMNTVEDINNIRKSISNNEGVVACQINSYKKELSVVYDNYFINKDLFIQILEDLGYTLL